MYNWSASHREETISQYGRIRRGVSVGHEIALLVGGNKPWLNSHDSKPRLNLKCQDIKTLHKNVSYYHMRHLLASFKYPRSFILSYETLFYNAICDFTTCVGDGIYE